MRITKQKQLWSEVPGVCDKGASLEKVDGAGASDGRAQGRGRRRAGQAITAMHSQCDEWHGRRAVDEGRVLDVQRRRHGMASFGCWPTAHLPAT